MTALMHAVEGQDLEVICLLLELGANPNDKDAVINITFSCMLITWARIIITFDSFEG